MELVQPACAPASAAPLKMPAVLPSFRLLLRQLQQTSLWDRLFTHCTGRDLLCKIVQHLCGVLRCLLRLWDWAHRRLVQHAIFRRIFFRGADSRALLPATCLGMLKPIDAGASPTGAGAAIAIVPLPFTAGAAAVPPLVCDACADDDVDAYQPPTAGSSVSTRLAHLSYTMYRARQVLRLGRWLYDIPDVKDSALELWYGTSEQKSMEDQEAEEEWEEHERVHVVRSRRASLDGRALDGRGTFTFPLSARSAASTPTHPARSASLCALPAMASQSPRRPGPAMRRGSSAASIASTSSMPGPEELHSAGSNGSGRNGAGAHGRGQESTALCTTASGGRDGPDLSSLVASRPRASSEQSDSDSESESEPESMTLLEWSVGVIDLLNSLMGLVIDASDDVEFLASLGLLPQHERVQEIAGVVSGYCWLLSGGVDVAMCAWKLVEYRAEMRANLKEMQAEVQRRAEAETQARMTQQQQRMVAPTPSPAASIPGWYTSPSHALDSAAGADDADPLVPAFSPFDRSSSRSSASPPLPFPSPFASPSPAVPSSLPPLSLCSSSCDVDCVHIESVRLFRYLGELGLSVCGVLELRAGNDDMSTGLELLMEASGLMSGLATFVKRGATHARSKSVVQKAEAGANAMARPSSSGSEPLQLYS